MPSPAVRMANDYNRALPAPIRWAHVAWAAAGDLLGFALGPGRREWAPALLLGAVGFVLVWPWDRAIQRAARAMESGLSGDLHRELFAWQQYGQGFAIVFAAIVIWLLDPLRRRRLLDLGLAVLLCELAALAGKMLVGRPRPKYEDPETFLGPFGEYPVGGATAGGEGTPRLLHAWEAGADLWSIPSSHTLFAVMLSVFLTRLYPRLRWLLIAAVVVVGTGRVVFGGHWPSDVMVGAAAGYVIASPAVGRMWGVRLLDWVWVRLVDRTARPMYPVMAEREAAVRAGRAGG